jgi:predicted nucleic acid-binding protein
MKRTNVILDEELLEKARVATGEKTYSGAINTALEELVRRRSFHRAFDAVSELVKILDAPMPLERFEEAARLYMLCRDAGVTVRKSYDCLIAVTAIAHRATVVHRDSDFDHIARVLPALKVKRV